VLLGVLLGLMFFLIYNLYLVLPAEFCIMLGLAMLLVDPLARFEKLFVPIVVILAGICALPLNYSICSEIFQGQPLYDCPGTAFMGGLVAIVVGLALLFRVLQALKQRRFPNGIP
jgi:hypothetical protein